MDIFTIIIPISTIKKFFGIGGRVEGVRGVGENFSWHSYNEKLLLAKKIFWDLNEDTFLRIMNYFKISENLANKYSYTGENTY